jgi:arginine:pyruvate transaminase
MREEYRLRRDLVCEHLRVARVAADSPGWRDVRDGRCAPDRVWRAGICRAAAGRLRVSVLAGEAFGPSAAGHIRIGLVLDRVKLADACARIALCAVQLLQARSA